MSNHLEIEILDPIDRHEKMAIEVAVVVDGEIRYCYFATPEGLRNYGDWIPETEIRIHYDNSDLIVVSEISKKVIESAILNLYETGRLNACTSVSS